MPSTLFYQGGAAAEMHEGGEGSRSVGVTESGSAAWLAPTVASDRCGFRSAVEGAGDRLRQASVDLIGLKDLEQGRQLAPKHPDC